MKVRENYPILDRMKVLGVLLIVVCVLGTMAKYMDRENRDKKISTIQMFLQTALQPVGSTMYVWGGGWNDEDSEAGATSTQLGLCPQWEIFANQQDETYDFNEHQYERENGLDCSGYVGWVIYNSFETENGKPGYVVKSTEMAENYAGRGWGRLIENPKEFFPGDIVSMEGHVWICLGTCADESVLLIHSSPPGISICGTQIEGKETSVAIELATEFMMEYFPNWQKKYSNRMVPETYLKNVRVFRWDSNTMQDAKEYQSMTGEEILNIFLGAF